MVQTEELDRYKSNLNDIWTVLGVHLHLGRTWEGDERAVNLSGSSWIAIPDWWLWSFKFKFKAWHNMIPPATTVKFVGHPCLFFGRWRLCLMTFCWFSWVILMDTKSEVDVSLSSLKISGTPGTTMGGSQNLMTSTNSPEIVWNLIFLCETNGVC